MKTILKKAVPVVLSAMLLFVGIVPATNVHAANPPLKFVKVLSKADYGVVTPDVQFDFQITKQSFQRNPDQAHHCPILNGGMNHSISYSSVDDDNIDLLGIPGCHMTKTSVDLLAGITFPEVGQYTYEIKEMPNPNIDPDKAAYLHSSEAVYLVSIFITEDNNEKVVDKIEISKTVGDDGVGINNPKKSEYTITDTEQKIDSNFIFRNEYRPRGGTNTPAIGATPSLAELSGFVLSKQVEGASDTSKFPFDVTLDPPWGITYQEENAPTYKIVSATGAVLDQGTITYQGGEIKTPTSIQLAHGDRFVLDNVLLGTFIRVNETNTLGYIKNISGKMDGITIQGHEPLIDYGVWNGENGDNHIIFTNTVQTSVGVLLANLPFIILFLVAAGGIALFVRNRRRAHSEQ